ncbi:MAG: malonyl CoA-acyl carrier protein transacylase, partial [Gemmatimonadetes bacterium]|nr:malonyl CoA-acyl carrier protein transacylase [Gemmatimonadota bacterium]NIQ59342.1 malonyl CoA-acyl carrier protein transacylase [Gemmatimonadota bacterium]NIU79533.1 malonyl CoA-acyl carrier protein transacylase [Gammaproteobacteria bacterium]NIX48159.1 malonyl CoA-acyl carrier protein transacylase [Gemmatimonadota bacterium]NIY12551.1 malonyl CoA-acyl carrier protein transacylase [Gemmatimonadota bacterium]
RGADGFVELGPGRVLAGLMRRIERRAEVASLDSPDRIESFLEG